MQKRDSKIGRHKDRVTKTEKESNIQRWRRATTTERRQKQIQTFGEIEILKDRERKRERERERERDRERERGKKT